MDQKPSKTPPKCRLYMLNSVGLNVKKNPSTILLKNKKAYGVHIANIRGILNMTAWKIRVPIARCFPKQEEILTEMVVRSNGAVRGVQIERDVVTGDIMAVYGSNGNNGSTKLLDAVRELQDTVIPHTMIRTEVVVQFKGSDRVLRVSPKVRFMQRINGEDGEEIAMKIKQEALMEKQSENVQCWERKLIPGFDLMMAISTVYPNHGLIRFLNWVRDNQREIIPDFVDCTKFSNSTQISTDALIPNVRCSRCGVTSPLICCPLTALSDPSRFICGQCLRSKSRNFKNIQNRTRDWIECDEDKETSNPIKLYLLPNKLDALDVPEKTSRDEISLREVTDIDPQFECNEEKEGMELEMEMEGGHCFNTDTNGNIDAVPVKPPFANRIAPIGSGATITGLVAVELIDGDIDVDFGEDDDEATCNDEGESDDDGHILSLGLSGSAPQSDPVWYSMHNKMGQKYEEIMDLGKQNRRKYAHRNHHDARSPIPHNVDCILCDWTIYEARNYGNFCKECGWAIHQMCSGGTVGASTRTCYGCIAAECMETEGITMEEWCDADRFCDHKILTDFAVEKGFILRCKRVNGGDGDATNHESTESKQNGKLEADDDDQEEVKIGYDSESISGSEASWERYKGSLVEHDGPFLYFAVTEHFMTSDCIKEVNVDYWEWNRKNRNSYQQRMALNKQTTTIQMGHGESKMDEFYRSRFVDQHHVAGLHLIHSPLEDSDWKEIEQRVKELKGIVDADEALNEAINDKRENRDSLWFGNGVCTAETEGRKYKQCIKSEFPLTRSPMKEVKEILMKAVEAYRGAMGTDTIYEFVANCFQIVVYQKNVFKCGHIDGEPLVNGKELFGFTLGRSKRIALGVEVKVGNPTKEVQEYSMIDIPQYSMYVMYGTMLRREWHAICRMSEPNDSIMVRHTTLTIDMERVERNTVKNGQKTNKKRNQKGRKRKAKRVNHDDDDEEWKPSSKRLKITLYNKNGGLRRSERKRNKVAKY